MAFIVETGMALPDANSFVDIAYFREYCTDRGYSAQAAWVDGRTQVALVKASAFFQARYQANITGFPVSPQQALCFPRQMCYKRTSADGDNLWMTSVSYISSAVVPNDIKQSVCELALIADTQPLAPNITRDMMNITMKKVGPIEVEYNSKVVLSMDVWRFASLLIRPYLTNSGPNVRMSRS